MKIFKPFEVIKNELYACEEFAENLLRSDVKSVLEAGGYIFNSGGKRVRPGLTILSGKLFNPDDKKLIPVAIAMEYIHTATLLHDDIVDGASLRRGKPSANAVFGNDVAVLVGDYMFAQGVSTFATYGGVEVLQRALDAIRDMSEGELKQLEMIGNVDLTEEDYFDIIYRKTASLLSTCCEAGAIIGGADRKQKLSMRDFGKFIGYAFQLVDDAFDYISDEETIGKPAGNDIREGKITYPFIAVRDTLREEEKNRVEEIFNSQNPSKSDINYIREIVIERGGVDKTLSLAREYVGKAKALLDDIDDSIYKNSLKEIADFIVARTY
ncbi:polyprenyl synthetase family protein [Desulfurobacterium atlanticum]|uniref:Octaprenyl-diphosphate synthase n=1 Tax=Desulfurobacterium atlanticum TaxID=240169 RepID=A0A238Z9J9_9BACT|nr:polyprenyl synthetase family protein [Desulfurobacterium atlanticum]SNR80205.1 octaprenyl-diphosphate synthase [Desulfurobacterium atlanticum]